METKQTLGLSLSGSIRAFNLPDYRELDNKFL